MAGLEMVEGQNCPSTRHALCRTPRRSLAPASCGLLAFGILFLSRSCVACLRINTFGELCQLAICLLLLLESFLQQGNVLILSQQSGKFPGCAIRRDLVMLTSLGGTNNRRIEYSVLVILLHRFGTLLH